MSMRNFKILMLAPTPYFEDCGSHVRVYEEAKALTRMGHSVRIVSYPGGRNMPGIDTVRIRKPPKCDSVPLGPSWYKPYMDIFMSFMAKKVAKSFKPHLIHAHMHSGAKIGGRLKKKFRIPLLFDYHGSMTAEMFDHGFIKDEGVLSNFFSAQERKINNGPADFIITRSTPMVQDLVERWGVNPGIIASVQDGVDQKHFRPYNRDEMRSKLRLPVKLPLVVFLGSLNQNQGIDTLFSAIVQFKSQSSPIRFLIMGYPEQKYRSRAVDLGIEKMIIFSGKVDYSKAPFFLSAGDIAVSTTCLPLEPNSKILPYMACGLPTIVFDTQVNREFMGDAGIYAGYDNSLELAEKISWLMSNKDERSRLGKLAFERAVQTHSWDIRARQIDEIYRTKLSKRVDF